MTNKINIDKNRSDHECSMVWHKLYSETDPSEELKEGVAVGEEVGPEYGTTDGRNDGVVVRARLYSQPQ